MAGRVKAMRNSRQMAFSFDHKEPYNFNINPSASEDKDIPDMDLSNNIYKKQN